MAPTPKIKFSATRPGADREHYVTEEDVRVVLSRLPGETWSRLKHVHFNDRGWGVRTVAMANYKATEVSICALPPRVSLSRYMTRSLSPRTFGAERGKQWPRAAVRRCLLYEVLLHELGHLQVVDPKAKSDRRKYAGEKLACEFAEKWRRRLWSQHFDHPDPVHNPPARAKRDEQ